MPGCAGKTVWSIDSACHTWALLWWDLPHTFTFAFLTIRLHQVCEMRAIASDDPIAWCVCQSITWLCRAKTAERIKVVFGTETRRSSRNILLDGCPDSSAGRGGEVGSNVACYALHKCWTDRRPFWGGDSLWPKSQCIGWGGPDPLMVRVGVCLKHLTSSHRSFVLLRIYFFMMHWSRLSDSF